MSSFGQGPHQPPPPPGGNQPFSPPPVPQGYGIPPAPQAYVPMATNPYDNRATTIMVLGILGLVVCGILGIVAWVMGSNLKKEAAAAGYPEPGQAKAGRICGIVAAGLMAAYILFFIFALSL